MIAQTEPEPLTSAAQSAPIGTLHQPLYDTVKVRLKVARWIGNLDLLQELCERMCSERNEGPEAVSVEQQASWMKRTADRSPQPRTSHA